jgi:diguanylate cyclase (GGDEF)-like protein/PAS domain S-box-containing protein
VISSRSLDNLWNIFRSSRESDGDSAKRWRGPHVLPSVAAAVIGVVLSVSAWFAVSSREDRLAELELSARVNDHALILQNGINNYLDRVVALRALFQSSDEVTRPEFTIFAHSILRGQTAILSVSWVPRITRAERAAHELAAVRDGLPGYRIRSAAADGSSAPAADKTEYFPVFYATSESPTSPVYGLDLNDGGIRQRPLERARDGDQMATTRNFLLRSGAGNRNGFFAVLPVYRAGLPHETPQDRRDNLVGFVLGVFQTGVMIETILNTTTTAGGLDLYFYAEDSGLDARPLFFHPSRARTAPIEAQPRAALITGLHRSAEIKVGDVRWTVVAAPIPGGPGTAGHVGSWIVLMGALLVSAVVTAYIWASSRHARRIQAANNRLDQTLAALNVANEQLLAQNVRFDTAISNMSQALLMFDSSGRLMMSNDRYCEMYGLSPNVVTPGCTLPDLLEQRQYQGTLSDDLETYYEDLQSTIAQGKVFERVTELPDGRTIAVLNHPMAGGGWVSTHEDITERRRAEAKIAYMARHDTLTDLPNRVQFHEQLAEALTRAKRGEFLAVLCLDIDHFKGVNDTLGHPIGDILLKTAADRLRECIRDTDTVARLGGDEFAVVQVGASQPAEATALATRLIEAISAPYELDGHQVVVGMSIGIAVAPDDGENPDQLLKNADMALYRAKADGRGVYRFFEPEMDARMQVRRALELDLRKAITNGEFELYYQPLVNIRTEYVRGFEALVRWQHPQRGLILPLAFIPLAEETGLIVPLGEWVLRQACREAATWPGNVNVAVNLSPIQFKNKNLVQTVVSALAAAGLSPGRLELEITESVLLQESDATLAMLHQLRGLGVKITMDDFGTGYSSLSYLRKFPFDKIKIDQSFIHDMSDRDESLAIVRAVTAMGTGLGIVTTAEGVETSEQLERLRMEGCTEVQGYFFSQPRPAAEVRGLLALLNPKLKAIA